MFTIPTRKLRLPSTFTYEERYEINAKLRLSRIEMTSRYTCRASKQVRLEHGFGVAILK